MNDSCQKESTVSPMRSPRTHDSAAMIIGELGSQLAGVLLGIHLRMHPAEMAQRHAPPPPSSFRSALQPERDT